MGEHNAPDPGWAVKAKAVAAWLRSNRGKVLSVLVVALPLVSRFVPDFPSDALLSVVRAFLGV
jgi:hypothetical protein